MNKILFFKIIFFDFLPLLFFFSIKNIKNILIHLKLQFKAMIFVFILEFLQILIFNQNFNHFLRLKVN